MSVDRVTHLHGEQVEALRSLWEVPWLEAYRRIGSTNDRAKELAADVSHHFGVVVALEQTKGRGRRGATWHSPPGSGLWMSVILPGPPALHVPLLVGLATARAIEEVVPGLGVGIEWPNDVMIRGRKVGGILCEGVAGAAVAGVGLNVRTPEDGFPTHLADRATSLEEQANKVLSHNDLAASIVRALKQLAGSVDSELHPDALQELSGRDSLFARAVVSEEHGPGTARGIDSDGALILERPDGSRVRVMAGSVRPV